MARELSSSAQTMAFLGVDAALNSQHLHKRRYRTPGRSARAEGAPPVSSAGWGAARDPPAGLGKELASLGVSLTHTLRLRSA